jgi:hypothetical protein
MEGFASLASVLSNAQDSLFVSLERITEMVGGMLKQLSEQLDTVRQKAGESLERVLMSSFGAAKVKCHDELIQALELSSQSDEDGEYRAWGDPKHSFRLAMKASASGENEYFSSVVAGMAVSIGGLTKSVSDAAFAVLVDWLEERRGSFYPENLAFHLLRLLKENIGSIRVSLPAIKTMQFLFTRRFLSTLNPEDAAGYAMRFLDAFKETERYSDDVHRLHALVDATVSLLDNVDDAPARSSALAFLCKMLTHRFPRVRSYTAEQLYVVLLDRVDASPIAMRVILDTPWASNSEDLSLPSKVLADGLGVDDQRNVLTQQPTSNAAVT